MQSYIYTIDVAHPPMHPDAVEHTLFDGWKLVRNHKQYRVLKVVHGYGSSGRGGSTKETVLNWVFQNRNRFENIIPGENFDLFDADTLEMIAECGTVDDGDLGRSNLGITLIWVH
ncbi:MAG: hypothetical protein H6696_00655 [Deferribacteres bacterium]|nr:hypothetical protein [candidate division KSB1 bacterium]MCB9500416.1 hypothetical protein [Deferribacteres bacterium]